MGFWNQRQEVEPVVTDTTVHESWSKGRDRYFTFLIDVSNNAVCDVLTDVTNALALFDCTRPAPSEYFHITVKQVGFVVEEPEKEDEISSATMETLANRAAEILSEVEPFTVQLPQLNLYPSVVFCEVRDGGQLETLHRQLSELEDMPEHRYDGESYGPHITLSQFQGTSDFSKLLGWLERNRDISVRPVQIEAVNLVEVNPHYFFPEFQIIERYPLEGEI